MLKLEAHCFQEIESSCLSLLASPMLRSSVTPIPQLGVVFWCLQKALCNFGVSPEGFQGSWASPFHHFSGNL